jgi:hypothetical protein
VSTFCYSQYKKTTVYFRDSIVKEGYAKVPFASSKLKFKETLNEEAIIFTVKEIDKFIFHNEHEGKITNKEFVYKIVVGYPGTKLVESQIRGSMSLYSITSTSSSMPIGGFGSGGMSMTTTSTKYYIGNNDSDVIKFVTQRHSFSFKRFKKNILKHFKDCKELIKLTTEKKEYQKKNMFEIINIYNKSCGK